MLRSLTRSLLAIALAVCTAGAACAGRVPTAARQLQELIRVPCARRGDCLLAVAAMMTGTSAPAHIDEVIDLLEYCDVVRPHDVRHLDAPATRGYASLLFVRALCERASLLTRLAPNSQRYAYKHMRYLRAIPEGGEQVTISGPELLGLMALSQSYWDHPHMWRRW